MFNSTDNVKGRIPHLLLLFILIYLVVFVKLNAFHMLWWDESMFAVNTYEMLHNGEFFTPYFNGSPDLFNTKPPLTSWLQIAFVKLIGYNELAVRLPSAIAACLTILVLFNFLAERASIVWAWFSALILLTSPGFINFHTARTGDSDALLTFLLFCANLYFIKFILDEKLPDIFLLFLFLSLAFFAKIHASLLFVPAYLIILIKEKKLKTFVFNTYFITGALLFVISNGLIFLFREFHSSGYLSQVLLKDAGRIFSVIEGHKEPLTFYLDNLFRSRFSIWVIILVPGIMYAFTGEKNQEKKLLMMASVLAISYFMIISFSITKLEWYDMPLYPLFALIVGHMLIVTVSKLSTAFSGGKMAMLIVLIFAYPYFISFSRSQSNSISAYNMKRQAKEMYIFRSGINNKKLDGIKVYYSGYNGSLLFYKYKLKEQDQFIELSDNGNFKERDKVLVSDDSLKSILRKKYDFTIIDSLDSAQLIEIKAALVAEK